MPPSSRPLMAADRMMEKSNAMTPDGCWKNGTPAACRDRRQAGCRSGQAGALAGARRDQLNLGRGKTGLVEPNSFGQTTSMSVFEACSSTARPPWFWPLTNLVGP